MAVVLRSRRRAGLAVVGLLVLSLVSVLIGSVFSSVAGAAPLTIVDDQGADDEPGQKDLNSLSIDRSPSSPYDLEVSWNWDDTAWSGENTGDAQALFDTDGDGNANYTLAVRVAGDPAYYTKLTLYSCGDDRTDRCTSQVAVPASDTDGDGDLEPTVANTGPFKSIAAAAVFANVDPFGVIGAPNYTASHDDTNGGKCSALDECITDDTVARVKVELTDFGAANANLVNVCSFPSGRPNSDPSDCVITPDNGFLTIVKVADPDDGTPFTFNLGTGQTSQDGTSSWSVNGSGSVELISMAPGAGYDLTEAVPAGWVLDSKGCEIQSAPAAATGTTTFLGIDNLEIKPGLETVCTFWDSRAKGTLTLLKTVVNDNGGTLEAGDFPVFANAEPVTWAQSITYDAGTVVTASETSQSGYTASSWSGDCAAGGTVTITAGVDKVCQITNDDQQAYLVLNKVVVNDNGGTAGVNDFGLKVDGTATTSGAVVPVGPGGHSVSEVGLAGYSQTGITGDCAAGGTVTVALGETKNCTITNDDQQAYLVLNKVVVNDNGGTAGVNDFGLKVDGTATTSGAVVPVGPGGHSVSEVGLAGYSQTGITGDCAAGGTVTVALGETKNCTITNDDQPGRIVVVKNAKPAQGTFSFVTSGTGYANFTVTGGTTNGGNVNSQTLNAGTYSVRESTQLGWVLTGIGGSQDPATLYSCVTTGPNKSVGVGDLNTATATITLKVGDTVTCTFENTGNGATRTQGFWSTHPELARIAWFGGSAFNHTFPGVASTPGIGDRLICGRALEDTTIPIVADDIAKLMGGFWSDIAKKSTGSKRTSLDQGRMQLLQQLLAAELNASAFGSVPSGGAAKFAAWESALCGTNATAIKNAQQQAAAFNSGGDSAMFTPGTSAKSRDARAVADRPFWDVIRP